MVFTLKNFGKITDATVVLNGITVICGNNNTGKSTVGKALFSFFNSLNDYKSRIAEQKYGVLRNAIISSHSNRFAPKALKKYIMEFIQNHESDFTFDEVKEFVESQFSVSLSEDKIASVVNYLNAPESDILNESVNRYFTSVMNGQIKNAYTTAKSQCYVQGKFGKLTNKIAFDTQNCTCSIGEAIEHSAYYINTPFSLDALNESRVYMLMENPMNRSVIEAIQQAQAAINEDSMSNILDSVLNKKDLEAVRDIIKKAYIGSTVIDRGMYYYNENGKQFDFRNISAGLKSFALIERMLSTGVLKRKDVLILDEPEIHLHTDWQIIYAELIVILQKAFDLTILLVTHSFHFLESLAFFMKKYEISDRASYYIPQEVKNGYVLKEDEEALEKIKQNISSGTFLIADMEYEYDMEHDDEGE